MIQKTYCFVWGLVGVLAIVSCGPGGSNSPQSGVLYFGDIETRRGTILEYGTESASFLGDINADRHPDIQIAFREDEWNRPDYPLTVVYGGEGVRPVRS